MPRRGGVAGGGGARGGVAWEGLPLHQEDAAVADHEPWKVREWWGWEFEVIIPYDSSLFILLLLNY